MKPYTSIDIETTGLDLERSEILQIAMIYDDLISPIGLLPRLEIKIKYDSFNYSEPYALMMNAKLIERMSKDKEEVFVYPQIARIRLVQFMNEFMKDKEKVVFAGKNVASFDIPMIRNWLKRLESTTPNEGYLKKFNSACHYKTIDVGSLYFDVFKENVSLSKINELTGRKEVSHDVMDDALDVVIAIRHKLGIE